MPQPPPPPNPLDQLYPDGPPPGADPFAIQVTDDPGEFMEAVRAFRARLPTPDPEFRRMTAQQRERAFWAAGVAQADMVTDVMHGIDRALTEGTTIEDFRRDTLQTLTDSWGGEIPGRVANIFRTNVQTAYGAGRYAQLANPIVRKARPYWQFRGVPDSRQSPICKACNNVILPADDPWWHTHQPPLHYQCRSNVTALAPRDVDPDDLADSYADGPPDVDAQEGFGARPTTGVGPWQPDPSRYPPEIRAQLEARIAAAQVAAPHPGADDEGTEWPRMGPQSPWGADEHLGARSSPWLVDQQLVPVRTPTSGWLSSSW